MENEVLENNVEDTRKLAVKAENINLLYEFMQSRSIKYEIVNFYKFKDKASKIKKYQALKNVSFEIEEGDVVGIIGRNGAGKSTLLRILAGVFSPNSGSIDTFGNKVSLLALGTGFQSELTGIENIYLNGLLLGLTKKQIDERRRDIINFAEIGEFVYHPVKTYSSGMMSRLAFSIAINVDPDILLIDEIVGVGDENFKQKSGEKIEELIKSGKTVIIVSHSMGYIRSKCNKVLWLEQGEKIAYGDTADVIEAYLNVANSNNDNGNTEINKYLTLTKDSRDICGKYKNISVTELKFLDLLGGRGFIEKNDDLKNYKLLNLSANIKQGEKLKGDVVKLYDGDKYARIVTNFFINHNVNHILYAKVNYSVIDEENLSRMFALRVNGEVVASEKTHNKVTFSSIYEKVEIDGDMQLSFTNAQQGRGDNFNAKTEINNMILVDLTEIFGEGNEPTKEECDKLFQENDI